MPSIEVIDTGLVYRNPKPHLRAIHAMHPSLSILDEMEMVVTFDIGQGPESLDYHTVLARSKNKGKTWELEEPLIAAPPGRITSHSIRTSFASKKRLLGFGGLFYRDDPEEGLLNRENFGYVDMDLFLVESHDRGLTWSQPRIIKPPFASPAWEVSHPILELPNGNMLAPVSTWRGWDGKLPCGEQSVAFNSRDGGDTWTNFGVTFDGRSSSLTHFEQSLVCRDEKRLVAVAWVYDSKTGKNLPSVYTTSSDGGQSFSPPRPTGFLAQTCKIAMLNDGRIVAAYRREDKPGLWASLVSMQEDSWTNLCQVPLWQGATSGMAGEGNISDELSGLKFGSPSLKQTPDGSLFLTFWCVEDCVTNIRWIRMRIQ